MTSQNQRPLPTQSKWAAEPSLREVLLLALFSGLIFVVTVSLFRPFLTAVRSAGDYDALVIFAMAIRRWEFHQLAAKVFWGMPYTIAGLSIVTRLPEIFTLLIISYVTGAITAFLSYRLWGGWIAAFFLVLNFGWLQRVFLGGTEPLFMALICGSFYAARKDRWFLAALLAALATTVRPVGIFDLIAVGVALLLQRDYKRFAVATATGLLVGALYVIPIALVYGSPLANVRGYQTGDWAGERLLSWPFAALVKSTLQGGPATNIALTTLWIIFVAIGFFVLVASRDLRETWRKFPVEMIFAVSYLSFLFTYNSPLWARAEFVRFAVPALPFVLLALKKWLPKDRRVLWAVTVVSSVLAACSAVGIRNVAAVIHGALR